MGSDCMFIMVEDICDNKLFGSFRDSSETRWVGTLESTTQNRRRDPSLNILRYPEVVLRVYSPYTTNYPFSQRGVLLLDFSDTNLP